MARKKKEKEDFFEHTVFTDVSAAEKELTKTERAMKLNKILLMIAFIGTVIAYIFAAVKLDFWVIPLLIAIFAALISGKIKHTLTFIWKVAKICYWVIPFFPVDVIAWLFGLALGLIFSVFVPVIPALYNYRQNSIKLKDAEEYLSANQA